MATRVSFVHFSNNPIEIVEAEQPLRIEQYGFVPDTGGPSRHRGGLALVRDYRCLAEEAVLQIRADRHRFGAYGLAGGKPGTPSRSVLNPDAFDAPDVPDVPDAPIARDDAARVLPSKTLLTVRRGDVLHHVVAGAGGYGDPFARDPALVLADVRNGKVTVEHARQEYGVAIRPDTLAIDAVATARLRA